MPPARLLKPFALAVLLPVLITCGSEPTGPAGPRVTSVYVRGAPVLRTGLQWKFTALARRDTTTVTGVTLRWTSSDTAVATVDASGLVTALAVGQATVSAQAEGVTGSVGLAVADWPVIRLVVSPSLDSVAVHDSLQLSALLLDSVSRPLTGRAIAWHSSDTAKATVTATGMVHVRAPGDVAITAASEAAFGGAYLSGQMPVARLLMPDSLTLQLSQHLKIIPELLDSSGNRVSDRGAIGWRTSNPAVLTIAPDSTLTPMATGTATLITSCCGGAADTTQVKVVDPVAMVFPSLEASLRQGSTVSLAASVRGASGALLAVPIAWRVEDTSRISIVPSADGHTATVTGRRPGTGWYDLTADTAHDRSYVQVTPAVAAYRVQPDTITLRGAQSLTFHLTVQDSGRNILTAFTAYHGTVRDPSLLALDTLNALMTSRGKPGATTVVASDSFEGRSYTDSTRVIVEPASEPLLQWTSLSFWLGATQYTNATTQIAVLDSAGNAMNWPGDVTITPSDTSIVVTPGVFHGMNGPQSVTVFAHQPGVAMLTARADSLVQQLWVVVFADAPAFVYGTAPASLAAGDSAVLTGAVQDASGYSVLYPVSWTSSDTTVAAVHRGSEVVGKSGGIAMLTPSAGRVTGSARMVVVTAAGPVVSAVSPALLVAGQPAVITGTGFSTSLAGNVVTIDTIRALVTGATSTELDIVPQAGACTPAHTALMTVAASGGLVTDSVRFATGAQLSVAPNQEVRLSGASVACAELALASLGLYDVTVTDSSTDSWAVTPLHVVGIANVVGPSPPAGPRPDGQALLAGTAGSGAASPLLDSLAGVAGRHRAILDASLAFARRAGSPLAALRAAPLRAVRDSIGPYVRFKIPRVDRYDFCSSYIGITAKREYVGPHVIVYLDSSFANSPYDSAAAALGPDFENDAWPTATTYFGDPLKIDSLLSGSGRVSVLLSPVLNSVASGFVVSCDFFPESMAPSSNVGETIYLPALPEPRGWIGDPASFWRWLDRTVLVHELKHVTAFGERLARGLPFDDTWLEEGSAVLAEELWSRHIYGTTWKDNATYQQTIACDVMPGPSCPNKPYAMFNAFALEYDFANGWALGTEGHTPLGPTSDTDASFYGSAWSLLRYTIDHYASEEAAFTNALVQSSQTGADFLATQSGLPWQQLLDDFVLSGVTDEQAGVPARLQQPSWNTASIWAGLSGNFNASFPYAAPFIESRESQGVIDATMSLHGGSVGMIKIYASNGYIRSTAIHVEAPHGAPAPQGVTLRIFRRQ